MGEQLSPALEDRLRLIERRLRAIEAKLALSELPRAETDDPPRLGPAPVLRSDAWQQLGTQTGLVLLVFAGAFLFRYLTKSGTVAPLLGLVLGMGYALFWLGYADTRAAKGQLVSATFCATAATLLVLPLIAESLLVFHLVAPSVAAFALAAFAAVVLWVAGRRGLRVVAWIGTFGTIATALLMVLRTHHTVLFGLPLLVIALATTWMGYSKDWRWLRWPCALVTNLTFFVALRAPKTEIADLYTPFSVAAVQVIAMLLPVAFFVLFRVIDASGRPTRVFAYVQGVLTLIIGFEGALNLAQIGLSPWWLCAAALGLSALAYHWALVGSHSGAARGLAVLFASLSLVVASVAMPRTDWAVVLLGAISVLSILLSRRTGRLDFQLQAGLYLITAALLVRLPIWYLDSVLGPHTEFTRPGPELWLVLMAAGWAYAWTWRRDHGSYWERAVKITLLVISLVGLSGLLMTSLAALGRSLGILSEAVFHFLVTVIGSLAVVWVGYLGHSRGVRECRWLIWPIYLVLGIKVALVDMRFGTEMTLFGGFAALGIAMLLTSRQRTAARKLETASENDGAAKETDWD